MIDKIINLIPIILIILSLSYIVFRYERNNNISNETYIIEGMTFYLITSLIFSIVVNFNIFISLTTGLFIGLIIGSLIKKNT